MILLNTLKTLGVLIWLEFAKVTIEEVIRSYYSEVHARDEYRIHVQK